MSRKKRSGGPKIEEGKRVSSQNATQHGLTGKRHVILPGESEDEYNVFLAECDRRKQTRSRTEAGIDTV